MECIVVSSDRKDTMIVMYVLVLEQLVVENLKKIANFFNFMGSWAKCRKPQLF
jgi:hypothetical protein